MKTSHKVAGGSAAVIAATMTILPIWEGMDPVAKKDMIGTGHPLTYCQGLTSVDGSVEEGQRFTPAQCDKLLAKALPKYLAPLQKCVTADVPVKSMGALLDAAFNAGPDAVCRSPMVKKMNAGDIAGGCEAFVGWYVTTKNNGVRKVVPGLEKRRKGDYRKGERQLCLEGLSKPSFLDKLKMIFLTLWKGLF
jgi:lysozyme